MHRLVLRLGADTRSIGAFCCRSVPSVYLDNSVNPATTKAMKNPKTHTGTDGYVDTHAEEKGLEQRLSL